MKWHGCGLTDTGKCREINEDRFIIDNRTHLYLIADGMGGVQGGEVAAQIVADEFPRLVKFSYQEFPDITDVKFQSMVNENIHAINDSIYRTGVEMGFYGMGSTLVSVILQEQVALIVHVGDSRCYIYSEDKLKLLTNDHSCPTNSYQLTRVLGAEEVVQPDLNLIHLLKDDSLLVCSDGLNHMVSDDEISKSMQKGSPGTVCRKLVKKANDAGGEDNITVIAIGINK